MAASREPEQTEPTPSLCERQPGESGPAFAALQLYLRLGPQRSLAAVALEVGKAHSLIRRWSSAWSWVERASEWDSHRAGLEQEAMDRVAADRAALWEQRRIDHQESCFSLAEVLRQRALSMLKFPLQETEMKRTTSEDGKTTEVTVVMPARWSLATAATIARTSVELAAMAIGEALEDDDFDPLTATAEECRAYLERHAARRKRPAGRTPEETL